MKHIGTMKQPTLFALLGIGAAVLTVWLRYWLNDRFFFIDDAQAQFYAAIHEISRLLRAGEAPWVSLRSWFGGNFAGEYVYGVFNPVSVLLMLITGAMDDLGLAAATFVSVHVALGGWGAFCLARHFGVTGPYAGLAAFAIASNNYLIYWYGAAWVAGLVGFTWFLWAVFLLLRAADRGTWVLPAAIAVALVCTAGYPASVVAVAPFLLGCLGTRFCLGRSWAALARTSAAGIAGTLMALPALVPAWAQFSESLRAESAVGLSTFLSGSFTGLLSFAFPSHLPVMDTWGPGFVGKHGAVEMPFYYVGWFLLPALAYLDWGCVRRNKPADVIGLLVTALAFLILCRIPSLSLFRWSFKYIPYYGVALVVLGTLILSRPELLRLTWRRTVISLGIMSGLAAVTIATSPNYWPVHLSFYAVLCGGQVLFFRLALKSSDRAAVCALLVSVAVIALSCGIWRRNTELPDPGLSSAVAGASYFGSEGRDQTVLNAAGSFCCDPVEQSHFPFGNVGYLSKNRFINGYSTMQPAGLHRELCINHPWGLVCDRIFEQIFHVDEATGVTVADLMGLDVVTVPNGTKMRSFEALAPGEWRRYRESDNGAAFRRERSASAPPGTLSWVPAGVHVADVVRQGLTETLRISADPSDAERLLVFKRAWYPGYRARLDGQAMEVTPHRGYIVAVHLPKEGRREGTLELYYRLPGMPWSGLLAVAGLLLAVVGSVRSSMSFSTRPTSSHRG